MVKKISPAGREILRRGRIIGAKKALAPLLNKQASQISILKSEVFRLRGENVRLKSNLSQLNTTKISTDNTMNISLFKKMIGVEFALFGKRTTIPKTLNHLKNEINSLFRNDKILNNRINILNKKVEEIKKVEKKKMEIRNKKFNEIVSKIKKLEKRLEA